MMQGRAKLRADLSDPDCFDYPASCFLYTPSFPVPSVLLLLDHTTAAASLNGHQYGSILLSTMMCGARALLLSCLVGMVAAQFNCPGAPPLSSPANSDGYPNCANGTISPQTRCVASCKNGFTSVPAPAVLCTSDPANNGWQVDSTVPTACSPVCPGPPPSPVTNGYWGTAANNNCSSSVPVGATCNGNCNDGFVGTPTIACTAGVWDTNSQSGACVPVAAGCPGAPPPVTNALPPACRDGQVDAECVYTCNNQNAGVALNAALVPTGPVPVKSVCVNYTNQAGQQAWRWSDPDDPQTCGNNCAKCARVCDGEPSLFDITIDNADQGNCFSNISLGAVCFFTCRSGFGSSLAAWGLNPYVQCSFAPKWEGVWPVGYCNPVGSVPCNQLPSWTVNNAKQFPQYCLGMANGTTCPLECNSNRVVSPPGSQLQSTCTVVNGTGVWSQPTSSCAPTCTSSPPVVPGVAWGTPANNNCSNSVGWGGFCNGTCTGNVTGSITAFCISGTSWSIVGACGDVTTCPTGPAKAPTNAQDSSAALCANTPIGGVCNVQCNNDFAPVPTPSSYVRTVPITCLGGTSWSNSTSSCQRVCPDPPPALVNGTWGNAGNSNCNGTIGSGGICRGGCTAGGNVTARCNNGAWTNVGICALGATCPNAPRTPINAQDNSAALCAGTPVNQTCLIDCNSGNAPVPTPSPYRRQVAVTCRADNTFSNATSECRPACRNPPPATNGTWGNALNANCNGTIGNGGICTGVCASGAVVTATCNYNSQTWDNVGSCGIGAVCPNAPQPTPLNAQDKDADACAGQPIGYVCNITCNGGHAPVPTPASPWRPIVSVTCRPDNTWTNATSQCKQACPNPPLPLTGGVWGDASNRNCNGTIGAGGVCTGFCTGGGTVTATCQTGGASGTWINVGVCQPGPSCTNAPATSTALANTKDTSRQACAGTANGAACAIACNSGSASTTFGTTVSVTCLGNNTWSSPSGNCERACTAAPPTTDTGGNTVNWQAGCTAGNVGNGGTCTGTCSGAGLSGAPVATCAAGGTTQWIVSGTVCAPAGACTTAPPSVENTRTPSCLGTLSGGFCTYTCNTGYNPNSLSGVRRQCVNGNWSTTATAACVSACPLPVTPSPPVPSVTWANSCSWLGSGQTCSGTCGAGLFGFPTLKCVFGTTSRTYVSSGTCSTTRYCVGGSPITSPPTAPGRTESGRWNCPDTMVNGTCQISCYVGYPGDARITCQPNDASPSGASWSTSYTGAMCKATAGHRRLFG